MGFDLLLGMLAGGLVAQGAEAQRLGLLRAARENEQRQA